ncbi:hypothetical protein ACTA71_004118 [Dictyostelium dimigraforme]
MLKFKQQQPTTNNHQPPTTTNNQQPTTNNNKKNNNNNKQLLWEKEIKVLNSLIFKIKDHLMNRAKYLEEMFTIEYQNVIKLLKDFYMEYLKIFGFNIKDLNIEPRKLNYQIISYSNLF